MIVNHGSWLCSCTFSCSAPNSFWFFPSKTSKKKVSVIDGLWWVSCGCRKRITLLALAHSQSKWECLSRICHPSIRRAPLCNTYMLYLWLQHTTTSQSNWPIFFSKTKQFLPNKKSRIVLSALVTIHGGRRLFPFQDPTFKTRETIVMPVVKQGQKTSWSARPIFLGKYRRN